MGPALAATLAVLATAPVQGPVLAGPDGVAYVTRAANTATARIVAAGERPEVLLRAKGKDARVDAGAKAVAVTTYWYGADLGPDAQSFAGTPGAALHAVSPACSAWPVNGGADGTRVTALGADCEWSVLDVADGAREPLGDAWGSAVPGPGGLRAVRSAPEASSDDTLLTVDEADGSRLYTDWDADTDPALSVMAGGALVAYAGGKVYVLKPGGARQQEALPMHAVLTPHGARVRGARAVGNRLALLLVPEGHDALTGGEVVTTNVDGGDERAVLRGVYAKGQDAFAYDGQDAAALVSDCERFLVVRGHGAAPHKRAGACPLALARRPEWSARGLEVTLACPGTTCAVAGATARAGGSHGRVLGTRGKSTHEGFTIPVAKQLRGARSVYLRVRLLDGPVRGRVVRTAAP